MKKLTYSILAIAAFYAQAAAATPTATFTTADSHVYEKTITFDELGVLSNDTVLTNQFAKQGVTFSGTARANGCGTSQATGWGAYGMSGNYVNTFGPGCVTNNIADSTTIAFDSGVSALAFDMFLSRGGMAETINLYFGGALVSTIDLGHLGFDDLASGSSKSVDSRTFYNGASTAVGILKISGNGLVFDSMQLNEGSGASNDYIFFDTLRLDQVAAVPEPSSILLSGFGLLAMCGLRRSKKA